MTNKQDPKNSPNDPLKSGSSEAQSDSVDSSPVEQKAVASTKADTASAKNKARVGGKPGNKTAAKRDTRAKTPAKPASGRGLAMLALLFSLIALGYGYWHDMQITEENKVQLANTNNENQRLQAELEKLQVALEALGGKIVGEDIIQPKLDKLSARIDAGSSTLRSNADFLTALQSRMTSVEKSYGALEDRQQISENALASLSLNKQATGRDVALAEVAFLVRAAAQRLAVFNDRDAAIGLLQLADRQLASMDRHLFAPVRHRIEADILALKAIASPDLVAVTGQLLALEESVAQWQAHLPERSASEPAGSIDGGSDLMAKFKHMVNSLVTIREDESTEEFLTLSQAARMKDRIRLELQAARVAALTGQQSHYLASIERVSNWLREYFDPSVATNSAALEKLENLAEIELKPQWPDLNPLLSLTRQLESSPQIQSSESAPAPVPGPAKQAPAQKSDKTDNDAQDTAVEGLDR